MLKLKDHPRIQNSDMKKIMDSIIKLKSQKNCIVERSTSSLSREHHRLVSSNSFESNGEKCSSRVSEMEELHLISLEGSILEKVNVDTTNSSTTKSQIDIDETQCSENSNVNNQEALIVKKKHSIVELHHSNSTLTSIIEVDKYKHCREHPVLTENLRHLRVFIDSYLNILRNTVATSQINISQASLSQASL